MKDKWEDRRFTGACGTCGQKFLGEEVERLQKVEQAAQKYYRAQYDSDTEAEYQNAHRALGDALTPSEKVTSQEQEK